MSDGLLNWLHRHAVAVWSVATALMISLACRDLLQVQTPYFFFATAIVLSTYEAGLLAGLLATFLGALTFCFFLLPPIYSFAVANPVDQLLLLLFAVEGVALSGLMALLGSLRRSTLHSVAARYLVAVVAVIVVAVLRESLAHLVPPAPPFVLFYSAVLVAAWMGGLGPGFFATALSGVVTAFLFYEPYFSFSVTESRDALRLAIFALEGAIITRISTTIFAARQRNERLERDAQIAREQLAGSESRLRRHNQVLLEMASHKRPETTDAHRAMHWLTESAAQSLYCERVGVWLFDQENQCINCVDLYEHATEKHSQGMTLLAAEFPAYFAALRQDRALAASDALSDPRTRQLADGYLRPLGISSLLDAPIRREGRIIGIVCHEQVGPSRRWTIEEEQFAGSMADLAAQVLDGCQLQLAAERLREQAHLLDQARDAILVEDGSGKITYWNQGAERLYGWPAQEARGQATEAVLQTEVTEEARGWLERQGNGRAELRQKTRAGDEVIVESRWTKVTNGQGEPRGLLVINTDVTERKKLESQLLRTQRLESIGALTSGIAHDLNNVLLPLIMGLDLLRMPVPEAQRLLMLDTMAKSVDRGRALVRHILAFVRGQGAKQALSLVPLLTELAEFLRHTFSSTMTIEVKVSPELWPVWGDSTEVYQVFLNLAINARDAMAGKGTLRMSAENVVLSAQDAPAGRDRLVGNCVRAVVQDTGPGIPAHLHSRIFEPFFTTKPAEQGTGLGLSTTRQVVDKMGGVIAVSSVVGQGTTFTITWPAARSVERPRITVDPQTGPSALILVVEEEASLRELARRTLEADGHRTIAAGSMREALVHLATAGASIRVVVLNLDQPETSAATMLQEVRQANAAAKIVACGTGEARGLGEEVFLTKPYVAETLLRAVRQVLVSAASG